MQKISSEAQKLQSSTGDLTSKLPEEARRIVTSSLKGLGNLHWIAFAFSMVAYVLDNIHRSSSNKEECIELLKKSVELAKKLQQLSKRMSGETDEKHELKDAVHVIVKGAITCCYYIQAGTFSRYFTAQTVGESLKDTRAKLEVLISKLSLLVGMDIQAHQPRRLEQPQNMLHISDPVGMEEPFKEVERSLDMKSSERAKAVTVYGFGGIGKTTLAEYVVSNLSLDGYKRCIVRIDHNNLDINKLQQQILYAIEGQTIELGSSQEGQQRLAAALKNQVCFLFIDNIVEKKQVKDLLPVELSLPSKSRILFTSRKNDVREVLPPTIHCEEYHVQGIPLEKSVELLEKLVLNDALHEAFNDEKLMIKDLAKACGGVPLLLTTFGKHLRNVRSKQAYEEALRWLQQGKGPRYDEEELGNILLYVYHQMKSQDVKDAFLDICIYFHGWPKRRVSFIVGEDELELLVEGALVNITESNKVIVHDVLRSLGISEGKATRMRCTADFSNALNDDEEEALKKMKNIKGIWFDSDGKEKFDFDSKHLNKMCKSLRVLKLGDGILLGGHCQCQGRKFRNLRYLKFENVNTFPFKDVSKFEKLAIFHTQSEAVCQIELDGLPQTLKELRLGGPRYPGSSVVHPSWWKHIENLKNLQLLKLSRMTSLNFPQDLVFPASLRELHLNRCPDLENLPRGFGQLTSLTDLTLYFCPSLSILPADLGGLSSLKCLEIVDCGLTNLPEEFGHLTSLTDLSLWSCSSLSNLPADFGGLSSLKCLDIVKCGLTNLPEGFGHLTSLTDLSLWSCSSLSNLPADFGGLSSLKCLEIVECGLTNLPEGFGHLTSLTDLTLRSCKTLSILPADFGGLSSLKWLKIVKCDLIINLPEGFGHLTSLTDLTLKSCFRLSILPADFGGLSSLKCLEIVDCDLTNLPEGFGQLTSLMDLTLKPCFGLSTLPADFGGLRSLERLSIVGCDLIDLPKGFGQLASLRELDLSCCASLRRVPEDFENLTSLTRLKMPGCPVLEAETMEKVVNLKNLGHLNISGSPNLILKWKEMRNEKNYRFSVDALNYWWQVMGE